MLNFHRINLRQCPLHTEKCSSFSLKTLSRIHKHLHTKHTVYYTSLNCTTLHYATPPYTYSILQRCSCYTNAIQTKIPVLRVKANFTKRTLMQCDKLINCGNSSAVTKIGTDKNALSMNFFFYYYYVRSSGCTVTKDIGRI